MSALVTFLISLAVLFLCAYLFEKLILPLIPSKWIKWVVGIGAAILIFWLLEKFVHF